ncbi:MAG: class I SAM-dependent methyltransferase [Bacteroidetes bacterium]|nr:class I SAM-dependent methyltransferase [Bacteroidota bacterium]
MSKVLFVQKSVPVFQNKVYGTAEQAAGAVCGDVVMQIHPQEGIVINSAFDPTVMQYDADYQNEQNYSPFFQDYIGEVLARFEDAVTDKKMKIAEIGCGKGYFLDLLHERGLDVIGFDPAYEGENPLVVKEYFDERYKNLGIDIFLLRHTMEHIPNPFRFLHTVAKANDYKGKIFIEVPTLDWIISKKSFWDIFYEHCNYFTEASFANFFTQAETGRLFNGQYMYILADLSNLKPEVNSFVISEESLDLHFDETLAQWKSLISEHKDNGIAIWGAGAKGSTFLNLLDPERTNVKMVVDVSPKKQNKFIAHTAHPIVSPEAFKARTDIGTVIIMNENYKEEIIRSVNNDSINFLIL